MTDHPFVDEPRAVRSALSAFNLMQALVVLAIVLVLAVIAVPVYWALRERAHKAVALQKIGALGGALATYAKQNDGFLPHEDANGNDSWQNAARPESKDAWYNALPRLLGRKGAGDYANSPGEFYSDDNILFLPGANYPDKKKVLAPLFAIAFNTKLQRNDPAGEKKQRTRLDQITVPAKTVVLLEQGVLNEDRTLEVQTKRDYDGSPKGSAKSFVGRYGGKGFLYFADGHAELVSPKDVLTETGDFPVPQTAVVWTRTPEENPNKDDAATSTKKKAKN